MGAETTGSASLAAARETPAPTPRALALPSVGECALRLCAAGSCRGSGGGDRSREERFSLALATRPPGT